MRASRLSAGGRALSTFVLIVLGLTSAGCTVSSRLGNYFGKGEDTPAEVTGSINSFVPASNAFSDSDLAFTRNAASDVLTHGAKDASQPWENPETGARGSVTPLSHAYTHESGRTCRDFLASYVREKQETWVQGEACRGEGGQWVINSMKPWRRT